MKSLFALIIIAGFTSMAAATSFETDRMDAGLRFDKQKIEVKMDSGNAAPVRATAEFAEVKAAECNAEAKDYSRLTTKAPSAPVAEKSDVEKKKSFISDILMVAGIVLGAGAVIAVCSGSVVAGAIAAGILFFAGVLCS